jgi:hypothetical protein
LIEIVSGTRFVSPKPSFSAIWYSVSSVGDSAGETSRAPSGFSGQVSFPAVSHALHASRGSSPRNAGRA